MSSLVFEKVGDVNSNFPYLCVYKEGGGEPFMEISVNSDRELEFVFYSSSNGVSLTAEEWREIFVRGEKFHPEALENGD
ncbi:hypothetical protein POF53_24225 [Mitsuaria sp. RG]|uniref:hypothetical protein n=1 Tax=Pseudomonas sp. RtIB026 TaxID=2749999 RepID=UPI0019423474|nr:hypothetical protein [Pseudomonas sp. RtIB026]MDC0690717.1 hypothetical protein [Mitsuaria sp. RG]BCJ05792.1 hypothetical protein PRtIB026_A44130 [Pseudomonas sp. RtIB026]